MQSNLIQIFYSLSQSLLTPVMVLLMLAMMSLVVIAGATARQAIERFAFGNRWRSFMTSLRSNRGDASNWKAMTRVGLPKWFADRCETQDEVNSIPLLLPEAELIASRTLARLQVFIRVGPMLGLVGTLLPLGPALQELSSSKLAMVGENLNVAFTTTVFGIMVGAVGYALHAVHRAWFERDLSDMECVLQLLKQEASHAT